MLGVVFRFLKFSVKVFETLGLRCNRLLVFAGPVTVPMVSTNSSPPIAMPVQVPPGHVVQQIVDESGTLRHVILSPQPPIVPMPPPHYVSNSSSFVAIGACADTWRSHHLFGLISYLRPSASSERTKVSHFSPALTLVSSHGETRVLRLWEGVVEPLGCRALG